MCISPHDLTSLPHYQRCKPKGLPKLAFEILTVLIEPKDIEYKLYSILEGNRSKESTRIGVTDWKTFEGLDSGRQGDKGES